MATIVGTNGNNSWTVVDPGTFVIDGLGGVDSIDFGTALSSDFEIMQGPSGQVFVDTLSGASQEMHATLINIELLRFDNRRTTVDLRVLFGDSTPPTVAISDDAAGTARGAITFTLQFSEAVSGLAADDLAIAHGTLQTLTGSGNGSGYSATVLPDRGFEGALTLTLRAAAVTDGNGNALTTATTATQAVDTLAPSFSASAPAAGSYGAAPTAALTLQFSEPVRKAQGLVLVKDGSGAVVAQWDLAASGQGSASGDTLLLTPAAPLPAGSALRLELPAGAVSDSAGNPLAQAQTIGFFSAVGGDGALHGTPAPDVIPLHASQRSVDGGGGIDIALASGARAGYTLATRAGGGFTLVGAGLDLALEGVERVHFSDTKLALDVNPDNGFGGPGAQVAMILGAVFGRDSVHNPFFVGIGLSLIDGGMGFQTLVQLALDVRLGAGFGNGALVDLLYTNVVGAPPTREVKATFQQLVDSGELTPSLLGVIAALHGANQANIDLAGLALTGLPYS